MAKRGLGILSWKGYETLDITLSLLNQSGTADLFDEKFIFFPEIDDTARALAAKHGFDCGGSEQNLGIYGGFKALAQSLSSDTVLLLENDLRMIEQPAEAATQLATSFRLIESEAVQVVCLRNCRDPGHYDETITKFRRFYPAPDAPSFDRFRGFMLQTFRPGKGAKLLGYAPYVMDRPEDHFDQLKRDPETGFWIMTPAQRTWTNQAVMINRRFFLDVLMERVENAATRRRVNGFKNIEIELNDGWWRRQPWKIAVAPGLFSHQRAGSRGY